MLYWQFFYVWLFMNCSESALHIKSSRKCPIPVSYTHLDVYKRQVSVWIVFCKYCSHRIESPYHSISHLLQKSEAFQSVHHVTFILCYTVSVSYTHLFCMMRKAIRSALGKRMETAVLVLPYRTGIRTTEVIP